MMTKSMKLSLFFFFVGHAVISGQDVYNRLSDELQSELDQIVREWDIPGALFSLRIDDEYRIDIASGYADLERGTLMRTDHRMMSGSTGKMFFAALALKLVEEGKLGLEDHVSSYLGGLPWYEAMPNSDSIRVIQLMNHTSGLPRHLFHPSLVAEISSAPGRKRTPLECIKHIQNVPALFPAGDGWSYSDANYILLGFIIESITGRDIYELAREQLIVPLGLDLTSPSNKRRIEGLTQGYVGEQNPFGLPDKMIMDDGSLVIDPSLEWTGGGFATNPADLVEFVSYVQESGYLNEESKALMRDVVSMRTGRKSFEGYGLGCFLWLRANDAHIGHSGFFPGYVTRVEYSLNGDYAIALQINDDGHGARLEEYMYRLDQVLLRRMDEIDESRIAANFKMQEDCWNSEDLKCYMSAYAKEDIVTVSSAGVTEGYDQILANYRKYFPPGKMGRLHFDQLNYRRIALDHYYVNGRFNLKFEHRVDLAQGYFSVMFKRVNGKWLMITDHSS